MRIMIKNTAPPTVFTGLDKDFVAEEPVHPAADGLLDPQETDAQRCSAHQTTPVCQGDLPPYRTV
jgi:hypothetical protein